MTGGIEFVYFHNKMHC